MDDELNVPVPFKGTKFILSSLVPTRDVLDTCQHFDMTSHNKKNPDSVNIRDLRKISQLSKKEKRYIYQIKHDTVYIYPIPTSNHVNDAYLYHESSSEKAILLKISSSFIQLKELFIAQINCTMTATTQNGIQSEIMPLGCR